MKYFILILVGFLSSVVANPINERDEDDLVNALQTATLNVEAASIGELEAKISKRAPQCSITDMQRVASCFYDIPNNLLNRGVYGTGVCNVRKSLEREFEFCAKSFGCSEDATIRMAIERGMDAYDNSIRKKGGRC